MRARTLKNCIWRYDVIIEHYGEDKNIPFGGQKLSYRVETMHTGWTPLVLQHIQFFENFENFDFVVIFPKKWFFDIFGVKNPNFKLRDSHFVDPAIYSVLSIFCLHFLNSIFGEFSNIYLLSAQSRVKLRHKTRPRAKNIRPILIFLHETRPNWCQERYAKFHVHTVSNEEIILEKRTGVGSDPHPRGGGWLKSEMEKAVSHSKNDL